MNHNWHHQQHMKHQQHLRDQMGWVWMQQQKEKQRRALQPKPPTSRVDNRNGSTSYPDNFPTYTASTTPNTSNSISTMDVGEPRPFWMYVVLGLVITIVVGIWMQIPPVVLIIGLIGAVLIARKIRGG